MDCRKKRDLTYETGPIRPPNEAMSLLLRVSRNCPWNRCTFCNIYEGKTFEARSTEDICNDIDSMYNISELLKKETKNQNTGGRITYEVLMALQEKKISPQLSHQVALFLGGGGKNVFLQDANSLEVPSDTIVEILSHLYEKFPTIKRVTSYARSMTLKKLGVDKLAALQKAGLTRLHVGLESGSDEVLKMIKKGVLGKHHIEGGRAAIEAGLDLSEYVMPGVGGKENSKVHATETARVLNSINPHFIRLRSYFPMPGSELAKDFASGKLTFLSEDKLVLEIRKLIAGLDGITSQLKSDHDRNLLMEVEGQFPQDKQAMLDVIDEYLDMKDEKRQVFRIGRRLGHFRNLSDINIAENYYAAKQATDELNERFGDADKGLLKIMPVSM